MELRRLLTRTKNPYSKENIKMLSEWLKESFDAKLIIQDQKGRTAGHWAPAKRELMITTEKSWERFIQILLHEIGHVLMTNLSDVDKSWIEFTGLNPNARIGEKTQEREVSLFAMGILLHARKEYKNGQKYFEDVEMILAEQMVSSTMYNGSNKYNTQFMEGYEVKTVVDTQTRTRTENVRSILVMNNVLTFIKEME